MDEDLTRAAGHERSGTPTTARARTRTRNVTPRRKTGSTGQATPRLAGYQVRASLRTRGEAARERQWKGAVSGPVGTPGQARQWGTMPHALSIRDHGCIAQHQGGQQAAIQQVPLCIGAGPKWAGTDGPSRHVRVGWIGSPIRGGPGLEWEPRLSCQARTGPAPEPGAASTSLT